MERKVREKEVAWRRVERTAMVELGLDVELGMVVVDVWDEKIGR